MSLIFEPPYFLYVLNICHLFIISTHKIWKFPFEFVHFHLEILNTVVEDFLTQFTLLHYYPRHYLCIAFCVIRVLLHMYILLAKKVQQTRQGKKLARLFSMSNASFANMSIPRKVLPRKARTSDLFVLTFLFCCVWCNELPANALKGWRMAQSYYKIIWLDIIKFSLGTQTIYFWHKGHSLINGL